MTIQNGGDSLALGKGYRSQLLRILFVGEQPNRIQWIEGFKDAGLDVVIPVRDHTVYDLDLPFVGWIPDFQHLRLPELFDPRRLIFEINLFGHRPKVDPDFVVQRVSPQGLRGVLP
jgi:hypothetical protein